MSLLIRLNIARFLHLFCCRPSLNLRDLLNFFWPTMINSSKQLKDIDDVPNIDILKWCLNMATYPCYLINTGIKYFLHFLRLFCTYNIIPSLSMKHSTNIFAWRIYNMLPLRFNLVKIKKNLKILICSNISVFKKSFVPKLEYRELYLFL